MSVSSFLVVVNALRLNLYDPTKMHKNVNHSSQDTAINVKTAVKNELEALKNGSQKRDDNSCLTAISINASGNLESGDTTVAENQAALEENDKKTENERNTEMNITIKINGMMCPHCSGRVKKLLEESPLVVAADVSHERGDAVVVLAKTEDETTVPTLKAIINGAGYETP